MKLEDITKYTLPTITKFGQDAAKAANERMAAPKEEQARQKISGFSKELMDRAMREKDPEKKARLLMGARQLSQTTIGPTDPSAGYSKDINDPYWMRAGKVGYEGGMNFALASSVLNPIASAAGVNPTLHMPVASAPIAPTAPVTGQTGLPATPPANPNSLMMSPERISATPVPSVTPPTTTAPPVTGGLNLPPNPQYADAVSQGLTIKNAATELAKPTLIQKGLTALKTLGTAGGLYAGAKSLGLDPLSTAVSAFYGAKNLLGKTKSKAEAAEEGKTQNEVFVSPEEEQQIRNLPIKVDQLSSDVNAVKRINGKWLWADPSQIVDDNGNPTVFTENDALEENYSIDNDMAKLKTRYEQGDRSSEVLTAMTLNENKKRRNLDRGKIGQGIVNFSEDLKNTDSQVNAIKDWAKISGPNILNALRGMDLDSARAAQDPNYQKLKQLIYPLQQKQLIDEAGIKSLVNTANIDSFSAAVDAMMKNAISSYNQKVRMALYRRTPTDIESNPIEKIQVKTGVSYPDANRAYIENMPLEGGSVQGTPQMYQPAGPGAGSGLLSKPKKLENKGLPAKPNIPKRYEYK